MKLARYKPVPQQALCSNVLKPPFKPCTFGIFVQFGQFVSSQSERTQTCIWLPCAMILCYQSSSSRMKSLLYSLSNGKARDDAEKEQMGAPLCLPESQANALCGHRAWNIHSVSNKVCSLLGAQWSVLFLPYLQLQTVKPNQTKSHPQKFVCPSLYQGKYKGCSTRPGDTKFRSLNIHYNHCLNAELKAHSEGKAGKFSSIFSPKNLAYSQGYFKNMDWSNYSAFDSATYTGHY